jgi:hypothetical protein
MEASRKEALEEKMAEILQRHHEDAEHQALVNLLGSYTLVYSSLIYSQTTKRRKLTLVRLVPSNTLVLMIGDGLSPVLPSLVSQ